MKEPKNHKKAPRRGEVSIPGLDVQQLEGLLDFMTTHGLEEFEYNHGGLHIRLKKAQAAPASASSVRGNAAFQPSAVLAATPASSAFAQASEAGSATAPPVASPAEELHIIKSPIVGTFYGAASPEAPPFVKPGDMLKVGQVVCIVEAMKLMNEIEADVSGELVQALVENGQPVEYGQALFSVRSANKKK